MGTDNMLTGEKVALVPCTNDLWHDIYSRYVPDPMMDSTPYTYDFERCEKAYNINTNDLTRRYFVIIHKGIAIGTIYLKHINKEEKSTEYGIALVDDSFKGKGLGTEAMTLFINYVFRVLGLETIYANTVQRNKRSQYIMEKLGFRYTHEDADFKYYRLEQNNTV